MSLIAPNSVRGGVGSDNRGKAQWLSVQEGKLTIFVVGGGVLGSPSFFDQAV